MTIQYPPCECGRSVNGHGYHNHRGLCPLCWIERMRTERERYHTRLTNGETNDNNKSDNQIFS